MPNHPTSCPNCDSILMYMGQSVKNEPILYCKKERVFPFSQEEMAKKAPKVSKKTTKPQRERTAKQPLPTPLFQ